MSKQTKKNGCFLSFLSSHKARLGLISEYFMKWLKDLDGTALDKTSFDSASFFEEVFGVHRVVLQCSVLVTPVIPSALKNLWSVVFFKLLH